MNLKQILQRIIEEDRNYDIGQAGIGAIEEQFLDLEISDIITDSRLAKENAIFFALPSKSNLVGGAKYIKNAVSAGVKIVICGLDDEIGDSQLDAQFKLIKAKNTYELLIKFLKVFYYKLPQNIYGITGTNGKTSIVEFSRQILQLLGKKSASIGTLGIVSDIDLGASLNKTALTTPDIASLYKNLAILKSKDIDDVVLEASSIGLLQDRLAGIKIKVGAFSNFSQDHLDYHQNMNSYFAAKMLLFTKQMDEKNIAVLNADIKEYQTIKEICRARKHQIVSYGFNGDDFKIISSVIKDQKSLINFSYQGYNYQIEWPILASFQVSNVLCALAMIVTNYQLNHQQLANLVAKFSSLKPATGRMQKVATLENNAQIFIDYAHTPDALENTLKFARQLTKARVVVLFGCGGNRDDKKRAIMGNIACNLADLVIVTDDNPRNEDAAIIRRQILSGCKSDKVVEIAGRKAAIESAIKMLELQDVLVLAGKGHENYQIIGDQKLPFDEEKIALEAIAVK